MQLKQALNHHGCLPSGLYYQIKPLTGGDLDSVALTVRKSKGDIPLKQIVQMLGRALVYIGSEYIPEKYINAKESHLDNFVGNLRFEDFKYLVVQMCWVNQNYPEKVVVSHTAIDDEGTKFTSDIAEDIGEFGFLFDFTSDVSPDFIKKYKADNSILGDTETKYSDLATSYTFQYEVPIARRKTEVKEFRAKYLKVCDLYYENKTNPITAELVSRQLAYADTGILVSGQLLPQNTVIGIRNRFEEFEGRVYSQITYYNEDTKKEENVELFLHSDFLFQKS